MTVVARVRMCMLPVWMAVIIPAQAHDERTASVGMRGRIDELALVGSELEAAPITPKSPVVVRVLATRPHGDHFRYDLEWCGFVPGEFDLTKFLARKNGSAMDGLAPTTVTVTSVLKKGTVEPSLPDPTASDRLDGYHTQQIVVAVLWFCGLLAILFVGRRWRRPVIVVAAKPTLADRLRPLVEEVASGRANDARKAELERLLVAFWRAKLDLREARAAAAIIAIRQHEKAGLLLRQVEAWLHMPVPPVSFDVATLLEPYRSVSAEDFDRPPRPAEAT